MNILYSKLPSKWQKYTIGYGNVYSSRSVIKNQFINLKTNELDIEEPDIWGEYNNLLKDYVKEGCI